MRRPIRIFSFLRRGAPILQFSAAQERRDESLYVDVVEGEEYRVSVHADTPIGHMHGEFGEFDATIGRSAIIFAPAGPQLPHVGEFVRRELRLYFQCFRGWTIFFVVSFFAATRY